jgi:hypothetical protein
VVWLDTTSGELRPDIYFSHSTDGGHSWSKALDISNTPGVCSDPAITVGADDSIHVVWVDTSKENRPDIFYSRSTDGGTTFSKYEDISPTPGISRQPTIAAAPDGNIHCAWADTSSGEEHPDIYYVRKSNGAWTTPIDVSNSKKVSAHPSLACNGKNKVFLAWNDNSIKENGADIWLSTAGKNATFEKPYNISDTPGVSSQPFVTTDNGARLAVVWSDTTSGVDRPDIFARISTDNGDDYSNVLDLTNTTGVSTNPSAVIVDSNLIIVWQETVGSLSSVKASSFNLKGIGTGPADEVTPTIHHKPFR